MNFKKTIKEIVINNHFFLSIISLIYSLPSRLRIKGWCKNDILINGAFLKQTKIEFKGKNNILLIAPENRLTNCKIRIIGNNCKIKIEKHCKLTNLELWAEDDKSEIKIGFRTTIEGGHLASTEGHLIKIGADCMFSHVETSLR